MKATGGSDVAPGKAVDSDDDAVFYPHFWPSVVKLSMHLGAHVRSVPRVSCTVRLLAPKLDTKTEGSAELYRGDVRVYRDNGKENGSY